MRGKFVAKQELAGYETAKTKDEVWELAPWACVVIDVNGGWLAFESAEEAETWQSQE